MAEESKRGDCYGFQSLAPEIITDILSRLPVESIMVCKCVCKAWNSLINDNYFAKLHLSSNPSSSSSHILFETLESRLKLDGTMKRSLLNVNNCNVREILGFPHVKDKTCLDNGMRITCSLDGLICFSHELGFPGPVVIYNPLISGDYVCLLESKIDYHREVRAFNVALGFDHSINKYKVVKILKDLRYTFCEVITIGKDTSWRQVVFPYAGSTRFDRWEIYHQGSIYWMIQDRDTKYILEFDLTKEVFAKVSFPNSIRAPKCHFWFRVPFQSLGEYLTLTEIDGRLLHIWRIVKQNTGSRVVGYRSMKIESPYKYAGIFDLIYLNNNEDLLLLQTRGGFEPVRTENGERIKTKGTQFSYYYPCAKKKNRSVYLPNLQNLFSGAGYVYAWCFEPSLVSIKEAMLNHL